MTPRSPELDRAVATVLSHKAWLAEQATRKWFEQRPEYDERYGDLGRTRCTEDGVRHLEHMLAAARVGRPDVFVEYVSWAHVLLDGLGIPVDDLVGHLQILRDLLALDLPEAATALQPTLSAGLDVLAAAPRPPGSFVEDSRHPELAGAFVAALVAGARREAAVAVAEAVEAGLPIEDLYLEVFQPALREVGRLWQTGEITVAQEHLATATTQLIMAQLYPRIFELPPGDRGTLVATCVAGNLHEVGIRMLADVFTLRQWDTHLVGANAPTSAVVELAERSDANVVAISATMIEQLDDVEGLIAQLRERTGACVLVGGAPFLRTPQLAEIVGADGTAPDARAAEQLATELVS